MRKVPIFVKSNFQNLCKIKDFGLTYKWIRWKKIDLIKIKIN